MSELPKFLERGDGNAVHRLVRTDDKSELQITTIPGGRQITAALMSRDDCDAVIRHVRLIRNDLPKPRRSWR